MNKFLLTLIALFLGYIVAFYTKPPEVKKELWEFSFEQSEGSNSESYGSILKEIMSVFEPEPEVFGYFSLEDSLEYEQAKVYFFAKEYQDAYSSFYKLYDYYYDFDSLLVYTARCALELGEIEKSEDFFLYALEANPENVEANTFYAKMLIDERESFFDAAYYAEIAIDNDNSYVPAYVEFARAKYYSNYLDEAHQIINDGLALDSSNSALYYVKALIFDYKNDFDLAFENYQKAIKFDSSYVEPYAGMGSLNFDAEYYFEAIKWYQKALRMKKAVKHVYLLNIGLSFHRLEKLDSCLHYYKKCIAEKPDYYLVYNNRGKVYFEQNSYDKALADYSKCVDLNSQYYSAYLNRGILYFQQGNYIEALNDFYSVNEYDPENEYAIYDIALAHEALENYDDAIEMYKKYIEIGTIEQNLNIARARIENLNSLVQ
ncbi:MAG: tetratricopeptide repeat protein [Bacteroidales bacterium]|nr:tetratricopeptide repeat protein [Bacteroidales bacterium]